VFSHEVESSSEDEPIRMARGEPWFQANNNDFRVEVPEFEVSLILRNFLIGYIQLRGFLSIKTFLMIRKSS